MRTRRGIVLLVVLSISLLAVSVFARPALKRMRASVGPEDHFVIVSEDTPWLGIRMQNLSDGLRKALGLGDLDGVLVAQVHKHSPAEEAGIEEGDVILEIDGRKMSSTIMPWPLSSMPSFLSSLKNRSRTPWTPFSTAQ